MAETSNTTKKEEKDEELMTAMMASASLITQQDGMIQQQMALIQLMEGLLHQNNLGHLLTQQSTPGPALTASQIKYGAIAGSKSDILWTGTVDDFISVSIGGVHYRAMILNKAKREFWQDSIRVERMKKKYRQQNRIELLEAKKFKELRDEWVKDYNATNGRNMGGTDMPDDSDGFKWTYLYNAHLTLGRELYDLLDEVPAEQDFLFYKEIRRMNILFKKNGIITSETDDWNELLQEMVENRLHNVPDFLDYPMDDLVEIQCGPYKTEIDEIEHADLQPPNARNGDFPRIPDPEISSTESSPSARTDGSPAGGGA